MMSLIGTLRKIFLCLYHALRTKKSMTVAAFLCFHLVTYSSQILTTYRVKPTSLSFDFMVAINGQKQTMS